MNPPFDPKTVPYHTKIADFNRNTEVSYSPGVELSCGLYHLITHSFRKQCSMLTNLVFLFLHRVSYPNYVHPVFTGRLDRPTNLSFRVHHGVHQLQRCQSARSAGLYR